MRETTIICSACGTRNNATVDRCAVCNASLALEISTLRVEELTPEEMERVEKIRQEHSAKLEIGSVSFFINGVSQQPIIIKDHWQIVLGRGAPNRQPPDVDLNCCEGASLGVSRRHAIITKTGDEHTLEDLGSTNGTWLNSIRLMPMTPRKLRTGDRIRLGQLTLTVYFRK